MERIHSRRRYLEKKGGFEESRGGLGRIRREDECRSKETRENRHGRGELPGKFMAKMLYGWDDGKFEEEYLKKLERNWRR